MLVILEAWRTGKFPLLMNRKLPHDSVREFLSENFYLPGLKESFRLTLRLNTRCSGVESLLSGQK